MRRAVVSLALLVIAGACQSGDVITADPSSDVRLKELGDGPAGIYVLRSVAGKAIPQVLVSHESYHAVIAADTIYLHADGTGASTITKLVSESPTGAPKVSREHAPFTYTIAGGRLTGEIPCYGLASCLAGPHYTGTVSANALELDGALNYRTPLRYEKVAGPSDVASVRITPASPITLDVGKTLKLSAAALDAQGVALSGRVPLWTSIMSSTATVTSDGTVRTNAFGEALIEAFIGGRADTVVVYIRGGGADTVGVRR